MDEWKLDKRGKDQTKTSEDTKGLTKRGFNDEAMACFSEALRLKPDYLETYYYKEVLYPYKYL